MTVPGGDFIFQSAGTPTGPNSVQLDPQAGIQPGAELPPVIQSAGYPEPILDIPEDRLDKFLMWVDEWLQELISSQQSKQDDWQRWEEGYRGLAAPSLAAPPFKGGSVDVVPVIAMAVDPIHARLDTGIFKQDPVFNVKPLRKKMTALAPSLSQFIDAYQRHMLKLRSVASPALLEEAKLGTCAFKTVYDRDVSKITTYDENFNVVQKEEVKFSGPRVFRVSIGDLLFPPSYQNIQLCPFVAERQRTTFDNLKVYEYSKKLANVDEIKNQELLGGQDRTALENARADAAGHKPSTFSREIVVYEIWCDYDINGDGLPEHLVVTYHKDTRTVLQLRYNWYFHQRKPYTVIPYTISNDSLYGIGIAEMVYALQLSITRFQRMSSDNAYIANIRMFIVKKNSGIEQVPRLYSGRCFFVDEPTRDFIPFQAGDIYPSTLSERQNLFGMVEKRTGVSDYLTGRESPIVGSRATATSTLALIQEGTRRVEEVLENNRVGFSEIVENCISIWIQYGTGGVEELFFEDDKISADVKQFFSMATQQNVNGLIGVELTATDASTARQAQQQMQLALIQIMMQYLEKLLAAGQGAIQALQSGVPIYAQMVNDVMKAARMMFHDLLKKYDIRNPEDYLPDLETYLNAAQQQQGPGGLGAGQGGGGGIAGGSNGNGGEPSLPVGNGPSRSPAPAEPAAPGGGAGSQILDALARANQG